MELQHVNVKFFVNGELNVDLEEFIQQYPDVEEQLREFLGFCGTIDHVEVFEYVSRLVSLSAACGLVRNADQR